MSEEKLEIKRHMIMCPSEPTFVHAYTLGLCDLCAKEKKINEKFDNYSCIHCKKLGKHQYWGSFPDNYERY